VEREKEGRERGKEGREGRREVGIKGKGKKERKKEERMGEGWKLSG